MGKQSVMWGSAAALVGALALLGMTNPALSEYQEQVLGPVVQERANSSDALLVSILQSLPIPSSSQTSSDSSGLMTVLVNRTKRENYLILSIYSTEFDYCHGSSVSRNIGKTVGIAGTFYKVQKGDCPTQEQASG